jgi:hypothetical protein
LNFSKSTDGGKTFKSLQSGIAHSDNHAIWINPNNGDQIMVGNDGGLNVSYDQGRDLEFVNTIPAAQFYAIGVDMRKPYYVYGGLQDNGSWGGPSQTRSLQNRHHECDWYRVGGGDGFYAQVDPTDYNICLRGVAGRRDATSGSAHWSQRQHSTAWRAAETWWTRRTTGRWRYANRESISGASPTPDTAAQLAAFAARRVSVVLARGTCSRMSCRHRLQPKSFASTGTRRFFFRRTIRACLRRR